MILLNLKTSLPLFSLLLSLTIRWLVHHHFLCYGDPIIGGASAIVRSLLTYSRSVGWPSQEDYRQFSPSFWTVRSRREKFFWFIQVLQIFLGALNETYELFYSSKFWVHFSQTSLGSNMFWRIAFIPAHPYSPLSLLFLPSPRSSKGLSYHLGALDYEIGLWYRDFGLCTFHALIWRIHGSLNGIRGAQRVGGLIRWERCLKNRVWVMAMLTRILQFSIFFFSFFLTGLYTPLMYGPRSPCFPWILKLNLHLIENILLI